MTTTNVENIDVQFRLDADVAPTYKATNFNPEDNTFEVYFNDGTLKNDEWYGPIPMDLDSLEPEDKEPLRFQIAEAVYQQVKNGQLEEADMSGTLIALNNILDAEQVVPTASFMNDLDADSLDLVELIMAFEEEFSTDDNPVEISDEDAEGILTVQDALNFLNKKGIS